MEELRPCANCGKLLNKKPYSGSKTGNVFCNHSCSTTYNNKNFISGRYKRKKQERYCEKCNTEIRLSNSSGYCGKCFKSECGATTKTIENVEKGRTGPNRYASIRSHARDVFYKDNQKPECLVCGYDSCVEIAHLKPISSFPKDTLIEIVNSMDNIVPLCRNHHWELDHGYLNIYKNGEKWIVEEHY